MTRRPVRLAPGSDGGLAAAFAALRTELKLSDAFPPAVEAEAAVAIEHATLPDAEMLALPFITIDPAGSIDLDQAMFLQRDGDGYRVYYAIADVPAFVAPGGAIDAEARRRGQTMYAPDGRIPLHPVGISEGAASLLPGEIRGAFVWNLALDRDARVVSTTVSLARVRSVRQCSYPEVQAELDAAGASTGSATDTPPEPVDGLGADTVPEPVEGHGTLLLLGEIGLKLIRLERERGGASLNRPEQEIGEDGGAYRLVRRSTLPVEDWNAQISLMTGMAAARLMIDGKIGILRTMPAPDAETIDRFRRQTVALGRPWPEQQPYGEYLRTLSSEDPRQLAVIHAASSLFRGAGYTAFAGEVPAATEQAAVAAPYAHTTAPLRRLVDRFSLLVCAALCAGETVPGWVRDALPTLPAIMEASDAIASRLDRGAVSAVEAALLSTRIGEEFEATVISAREGGGVIQLADPAVTANCDGALQAGAVVRAKLLRAEIATGTVQFAVTPPGR